MIKPTANDVMLNVKLLSNPKKFYKVKQHYELSNPHYIQMTINGCQKKVINNYAVEAQNLKDNVAIIFQTLKNKCVMNVDPAQQNLALVQEHLSEVLSDLRSKMKKSYDGVVALVAGGRAYDVSNKFSDKSIKFTDAICEFMEDERIPSTKLLEQNLKKPEKGINVYTHRNNAVISSGIIDEFAKASSKAPENINSIAEDFFDVFEVSPQAPISFVDEILPMPSTNLKYRQGFILE